MDLTLSSVMLLLIATILSITDFVVGDDLARGWNSNINWMNLADGLEASKTENKPLMLLIHKSWCGACKNLKPRFSSENEIEALSNDFIMVNTLDEEEPTDKQFSPDGGYIPRIFFLDSQGTVDNDIYNLKGNPSYKYFYPQTSSIINSMKTAKEKLSGKRSAGNDEL